MKPYGAPELANSFRTVRKNTIQVAEDIPEDKYAFVAAAGVQSVGDLLRHIVTAPKMYEDMHRVQRITTFKGHDFGAAARAAAEDGKKLKSKSDILGALRSEGEQFATWLESLDDAFFSETVTDGTLQNPKSRFELLLGVKEHEMHHRGQLMLMQRMIGVVPHLTREREERRRRQASASASASAAASGSAAAGARA